MGGKAVFTPEWQHACAPGWTTEQSEGTPDGLFPAGCYALPPQAHLYPRGTVWECGCGRTWVSAGPAAPRSPGFIGFRPERRGERRRRLRGSPS